MRQVRVPNLRDARFPMFERIDETRSSWDLRVADPSRQKVRRPTPHLSRLNRWMDTWSPASPNGARDPDPVEPRRSSRRSTLCEGERPVLPAHPHLHRRGVPRRADVGCGCLPFRRPARMVTRRLATGSLRSAGRLAACCSGLTVAHPHWGVVAGLGVQVVGLVICVWSLRPLAAPSALPRRIVGWCRVALASSVIRSTLPTSCFSWATCCRAFLCATPCDVVRVQL